MISSGGPSLPPAVASHWTKPHPRALHHRQHPNSQLQHRRCSSPHSTCPHSSSTTVHRRSSRTQDSRTLSTPCSTSSRMRYSRRSSRLGRLHLQ
jgi:hypothetical protein